MLEKRIQELGNYFDGIFPLKEGYTGIRIIIPNNWTVYEKKTSAYNITVANAIDNGIKKTIFIGDPNAKITDIMDFVKEVITRNLENEAKKTLFKSKVNELATIFDNNNLSLLENIVFKFEKPRKVKKTKLDTGAETNVSDVETNVSDVETNVSDGETNGDTIDVNNEKETNNIDGEDEDKKCSGLEEAIQNKINLAILKNKK